MSTNLAVPSMLDRYVCDDGTVYLTGIQALVRMLLDQRRLDRARGLRTAGFVSGYEGSPLAGYDLELARRSALLDEHDVIHRPGLNEELAATAVQGTQLAATRPDVRVEGIFGVWYGKAPGLDRATDALRHANLMGTHPAGGALALVGDDPIAKSSTVPSASEPALADLCMPTVYPADVQEIVDLGLHAIAMSRASGLWTAMKLPTNVVDGGGMVRVGPGRVQPVLPEVRHDGRPYRHAVTARLLPPVPVVAESTAFNVRLEIAREYAALNALNPMRSGGRRDRFGILTAGKAYLDVCQALRLLGLDEEAQTRYGIRVLKLGMIFPLEPRIIEAFAEGLDEILVVEEKRPFLETAVKAELYGRTAAPRILGKRDDAGSPLLANDGELDVDAIATALATRLARAGDVPEARAWLSSRAPRRQVNVPRPLPLLSRTPYFCSGCPHNRSTQVPEGSLVGGGIGCHSMVLFMEPEQVGDVVGVTQMGGEGTQWLGMEPFLATRHLVQNIGDGTFHHSGSLAVRAAVAADANITFKLLYNSAVAMTGGQAAVGVRTVPQLTELLAAEGVARIIVTTEEPARYRGVRLARGAQVWHRDRLEEAQRVLADVPGVTVLIHDQQCAAEKRRERKRRRPAVPEVRVLINERVCEGCGDCGTKSNCLSVQPVATEYGRKTRIHQASCNTDYSCLDGDCPSFVTVRPGKPKPAGTPGRPVPPPEPDQLPDPVPCVDADDFTVRITGIGGTGVVTVAQILAAAAHHHGLFVRSLDQTGLSQKGGAVVSDIKLSRAPSERANKLAAGECDVYVGCDILVAAQDKHLDVADRHRTVAVVSTAQVPTGRMVVDTGAAFPGIADLTSVVAATTRASPGAFFDARAVAVDAFGDDQYANVILLGAAYQLGALPLPLAAFRHAITLNGASVEVNLRAFELGRRSVLGNPVPPGGAAPRATLPDVAALVARFAPGLRTSAPAAVVELATNRAGDLVGYQSAAYAQRYLAAVEAVWRAESSRVPGRSELTEGTATYLYKLMAYKDEYEVARLCLDPEFRAQVAEQFGSGARFAWRLHPPVLRALGLGRKVSFGRWATPLLAALRAGRRVRGTRWDLFGLTEVRRTERRLVAEYMSVIEETLDSLHPDNHDIAVQIAGLPDQIRGYEHVKLVSVGHYAQRLSALRAQFSTAGPPPASDHTIG
ncbi:pyruvate ferredoxin/flavodoxin oxidoreductase [Dactylosporangium sucinum]|uniref:Pyruvate ferredoxin/flavodoxin oxidoreductase n=1 Tax=Dactylosporangium sucinum TaxID=1424081 RepID=A0A917TU87_9ACTN|nr:pyruvate ferredoxin/flavodoxin oxidoreductase [Dactylosporangium sucinum]